MDMTIVGMISGTSYDAVDAAVADLALVGDVVTLHPRGLTSAPIPESMRARIAAALPPHDTTMAEVCRLDTELGQMFGEVAAEAFAAAAVTTADLVVSHGQTVYHWVEDGTAHGTLQLGSPSWIAAATGLPVLSDVRTRDLTRGGHGAPLASTIDALLVLGEGTRRGSLNLGGIANITTRDDNGSIVAYDIGPASALIDQAAVAATDGRLRMDVDGAMARQGSVSAELLETLLSEPYYAAPAPKSTGKELFHADYVTSQPGAQQLSTVDLLATLTELTAELVARACWTHRLDELVVAGGGVRNPFLMERIRLLSAPVTVSTIDDLGIPAQAKEAYLMALLGFLSVHGLHGTIASATGASEGSILGSITPGATPLRLPAPASTQPRSMRILP